MQKAVDVAGQVKPSPCRFTIETQAKLVHEVNRVWQRIIGEKNVSPPWHEAPEHQRTSTLELVKAVAKERESGLYLPMETGEYRHNQWLESRLRDGWRYGPEKNEEQKTHPCLLPYHSLPPEQKVKDHLASAVLNVLQRFTVDHDPR